MKANEGPNCSCIQASQYFLSTHNHPGRDRLVAISNIKLKFKNKAVYMQYRPNTHTVGSGRIPTETSEWNVQGVCRTDRREQTEDTA